MERLVAIRHGLKFSSFNYSPSSAKGECDRTSIQPRRTLLAAHWTVSPPRRSRDYEVIVVDDASSDGTAGIIQTLYGDKVRLIRCSENRGAAAARNVGVAAASGHYVAFLDSDDTWEPEKLALQVTALEHATTGVLGVQH